VMMFANGRLVLKYVLAGAPAGTLCFFTSDPVSVRWMLIAPDPVLQMEYRDNAGQPLQFQALDDRRVRVSATLYDALGRAHVTTTAALAEALLGYRQGFTAPLAEADGRMGPCELTAAYPGDDGFPFSRVGFEPTPLERIVEQGGPGADLALNP